MSGKIVPIKENCSCKNCDCDPCVYCGGKTPHKKTDLIEDRLYYIEGSGQLCTKCWLELYSE